VSAYAIAMLNARRYPLWHSVFATLLVYALLLVSAVPQGTMLQASADGWTITLCGDNGQPTDSGDLPADAPAAQPEKCVWATYHAVTSVLPTAALTVVPSGLKELPLTLAGTHQPAYAGPRRANWAQGPPHLV